jgi:two-component system, OmpR family, sensor kinase
VTLATRILLTYSLLLGLAIGGAALSALSAHRASFELEQADFANRLPKRYLALSNHSYQLFKQFGDAILIGDRDLGTGEMELIDLIRDDFDAIRYDIGKEAELIGESQMDEYQRLAEIERLLNGLISEHYAILELKKGGAPLADLSQRLARMHDEVIDKDFNRMIRDISEEAASQLRAMQEAAARRMQLLDTIAIAFLLIALVSASATVWTLVRDIRGPLRQLSTGTRALAAGELEHRIETNGPGEFRNLAGAFNLMAGEIARREADIAEKNRNLEETIAARTADLARALDALKANEAKRRQLLADVSHELRTPLTIIRGEADIALRGPAKTPEEYREALEKTRSAADHGARIVDDLLFVARREARDARLILEDLDLSPLLARLVDETVSLAESSGTKILYEETVAEANVRADAVRIRQVMLILIENATNYGGDVIRVALERVPSGYMVSVSDNGPGVTRQDRDQAFERFFRGSNAAQRYDRGTGLGLPVAKAIVESHGGEIAMRSAPGEGVTVIFTLPTRPMLRAVS